jgi:hypothetical protein
VHRTTLDPGSAPLGTRAVQSWSNVAGARRRSLEANGHNLEILRTSRRRSHRDGAHGFAHVRHGAQQRDCRARAHRRGGISALGASRCHSHYVFRILKLRIDADRQLAAEKGEAAQSGGRGRDAGDHSRRSGLGSQFAAARGVGCFGHRAARHPEVQHRDARQPT